MDQQTFEQQHRILEEDIARLSREMSEKRVEMGNMEKVQEREIVKESLRTMSSGVSPASQTARQPAAENNLFPAYLQSAPNDTKLSVERLLDLSLHKGIEAALREAKKGDPYILDAFHDALVERLYPELQKRGLVK